MSLKGLCESLFEGSPNNNNVEKAGNSRILCPEYSLHVKDKKTYPLSSGDPLFLICWYFQNGKDFNGLLIPSSPPCYSRFSYFPASRTQMHTHDYLELAYPVYGSLQQNIMGKDITFMEGELCLIDKNCVHRDYLSDFPSFILFFGIANEAFDDIMSNQLTSGHMSSFLQSALLKQKNLRQYLHLKPKSQSCTKKMEHYLYHLVSELKCYDAASPHILRGYLMRVFYLLCEGYHFSISKTIRQEMNWMLFNEVSEYIKNNLPNISIRQLREQFHFQEDYFNRLIKSKTGMTYTKYVHQLRLAQAEKLLADTNYTIEQIVTMTGYQNKGYFYKLFAAQHHMTPANYRLKTRLKILMD